MPLRVLLTSILACSLCKAAVAADSWTCSYVGFGTKPKSVSIHLFLDGAKLTEKPVGPTYDILENNQYAVIAADHYARFDALAGKVRIFSSTVIIDKIFGQFIYTVGEIGEEPGYRKGHCKKE